MLHRINLLCQKPYELGICPLLPPKANGGVPPPASEPPLICRPPQLHPPPPAAPPAQQLSTVLPTSRTALHGAHHLCPLLGRRSFQRPIPGMKQEHNLPFLATAWWHSQKFPPLISAPPHAQQAGGAVCLTATQGVRKGTQRPRGTKDIGSCTALPPPLAVRFPAAPRGRGAAQPLVLPARSRALRRGRDAGMRTTRAAPQRPGRTAGFVCRAAGPRDAPTARRASLSAAGRFVRAH